MFKVKVASDHLGRAPWGSKSSTLEISRDWDSEGGSWFWLSLSVLLEWTWRQCMRNGGWLPEAAQSGNGPTRRWLLQLITIYGAYWEQLRGHHMQCEGISSVEEVLDSVEGKGNEGGWTQLTHEGGDANTSKELPSKSDNFNTGDFRVVGGGAMHS